jgi:hypothetical protein
LAQQLGKRALQHLKIPPQTIAKPLL